MMIRTTSTTTKNTTTTTIIFDKPPSTTCGGFTDVHGTWINGFVCPIENSIQYFCCGTDNYRYCCSPDRYSFETRFSNDYPQVYDNILTDEISSSLINNRKMINKQFEQFQRYFLPIFLLTTTIFFLVGIALWFWLYKHKTFYSLGQDDLIESGTLQRTENDSMKTKRETINHTLGQQQSQLYSYSSTAV